MVSKMRTTTTPKALVVALLQAVQAVAALADSARSYRRRAAKLVRRIQVLEQVFEEVREGDLPLAPTVLKAFQDLHVTLQTTAALLEQCRDGSKLYMVMNQPFIMSMFQEVTSDLIAALDKLPLELIGLSEDTKEQVELVHMQLRRSKGTTDSQEEQLYTDIKNLLAKERQGCLALSDMQSVAERLDLMAVDTVAGDIRALQKQRALLRDRRLVRQLDPAITENEMSVTLALLRKWKTYIGGDTGDDGTGSSSRIDAAPQPPEDFKCPVSLELMHDPVIVATGQTYERACIQKWLDSGQRTCPKTQQKLSHLVLIPNYVLRSLIAQWCDENGVEVPKKPGSKPALKKMGRTASDIGVEVGPDQVLVKTLLEKLTAGPQDVTRAAAGELRLLAKKSMENRVCIARSGAIPKLVGLLTSPDQKTQEHAVTALLNLSINEDNKASIVQCGAIDPIVTVLRNGSMEARENAAATLFSLSVVDDNKVSIGNSGAIPALVELLEEGTPRGKKDAATALFNLSIYGGNKSLAVRAGVVPPLMDLLIDRTAGMTDEALAILAILTTASEGRAAIGQASAVPALVDLIRVGTPRNKENAAAVLLALCLNGVAHSQSALELGVVPPLSSLLQAGTPRAKRKAAQLLQHLEQLQQQNSGVAEQQLAEDATNESARADVPGEAAAAAVDEGC
eukprot:SM000084S23166  [mRNA]  locus=s84:463166:467492:- [translate_table: standard]